MIRLYARPHGLFVLVLGLLVVTIACRSASQSPEDRKIHMVNVADQVQPKLVLAGRGDEVRWRNARSQPIVVSFPQSAANRISCRMGFTGEGDTALFALIDVNASASLCFTEQGKYNYQVRMNQNIGSALTSERAIVWIVGRGERNPDPYEEYINITP